MATCSLADQICVQLCGQSTSMCVCICISSHVSSLHSTLISLLTLSLDQMVAMPLMPPLWWYKLLKVRRCISLIKGWCDSVRVHNWKSTHAVSFWIWTHRDFFNRCINQIHNYSFPEFECWLLEIRGSFVYVFNEYLEWNLGPKSFVIGLNTCLSILLSQSHTLCIQRMFQTTVKMVLLISLHIYKIQLSTIHFNL